MKNMPQKNDWIVIASVSIAAGLLLVAVSANAFYDAIKEDAGVARFVSGLILLLCGILRLIQRKQDKSMIDLGILNGELREKSKAEQDAPNGP